MRAARTDKGVSAVGNIVNAKLEIPAAGEGLAAMTASINAQLPADVRVFDTIKVAGGFHAKDDCTKRKYTYLLPTYLLAPAEAHAAAFEAAGVGAEALAELRAALVAAGDRAAGGAGGPSWQLPPSALAKAHAALASFRVAPAQLAALRASLGAFVGTKNFWNFTSKLKHSDASAKRYILSFECGTPFVSDAGLEWLSVSVVGQSFLLHQIRKMVATTVEVARGALPAGVFTDPAGGVFSATPHHLPIAPGDGLFLERPYFEVYNTKFGRGEGRRPLAYKLSGSGDHENL